jgi:tetratricopeptide (TPR) repeat protein
VQTFLGAAPQYLRLFYWPARLSVNYSPPLVEIVTRWDARVLPGVAIIAAALAAFALAVRRAGRGGAPPPRVVFAFAIAWLAITLLIPSGALFAIGVLLAERTLLLPSVGAMLGLGVAASWLRSALRAWAHAADRTAGEWARAPRRVAGAVVAAAFAALVCVGAWRSAARQRVWHDDDAWAAALLADAPGSSVAYWYRGTMDVLAGRYAEGTRAMRDALQLYPRPEWMEVLATHYANMGRCDDGIPLVRRVLALAPERWHMRHMLARCYLTEGKLDSARAEALRLRAEAGRNRTFLARADSVLAAVDSASTPPASAGGAPGRWR